MILSDFRLMTKFLEKDKATKLKTQETFCEGNGKSVWFSRLSKQPVKASYLDK